jgi:hypothetical protein
MEALIEPSSSARHAFLAAAAPRWHPALAAMTDLARRPSPRADTP